MDAISQLSKAAEQLTETTEVLIQPGGLGDGVSAALVLGLAMGEATRQINNADKQ